MTILLDGLRPVEAMRLLLFLPEDEGGLGFDPSQFNLDAIEEFDTAVSGVVEDGAAGPAIDVILAPLGAYIIRTGDHTAEIRIGDPDDDPECRKCRECGCTETTACQTSTGPCSWAGPDLCSACQ